MTRPPNKRVSRGQPIRRGAPAKPASGCKGAVKMAVAVIAVGLVLLVFHFFAPVLLLAALPSKEWRKAAIPDLASLALQPPGRRRREPRQPDLLRGGAG